MKIGYLVNNINSNNGGGRYAANLINGMKFRGHDVVVLKEVNDGLPGYVVLSRGWKIFTCIREARKLLRDCDVIHAIDGYPYGVIAWLVNRKLNKKLIISALGTYAIAPLYRWQTSYLLKCAYLAADAVAPISHFTAGEIYKKISLHNVTVINPGIDIGEYQRPGESENQKKQYILSVGALKKRKGYHVSLSAFAIVSRDFPLLDYYIVADTNSPYQKMLKKIIQEHGLEKKVHFLNNISEDKLAQLYRDATLFILTPINTDDFHFEGYGIVYLEAARAGLPVIGTLGTGAEDAINNRINGILVSQNDVKQTAEAMLAILSDKEKLNIMSKNSYEWAKLNSIENQITKFLKLYEHASLD